ncbi:S41 family peptidase [Flavobacterium filum]|uniref:S41 family peptidase n=1 Tax=Flavobacterium filum TaxID=370974 RepID=UPI0023F0E20C|nr:S41 family peptidase [Flavobacterium filum]
MTNFYTICLTILICCLVASCGSKSFSTTSVNQIQTNEDNTKKLSIVAKLKENAQLPIEERIALYHKLKKENLALYDFDNETELTLYGYSFLWENNLIDAIPIFGLVISEFPNSANAYDSMGEAYLQAKDSTKALQFYEKSLLMNPDNFYAEDVIQKIKFPNIKPLTAKEKFSKVYDKKDYVADLNQLGQKLLAIHPQALKFITKEQFWKNIESKKSLITEKTTYAEFAWHCNEIIASIGCSHTASSTMQNDYHEFSILPIANSFPLQVRLVNKQLFVVNPMNNSDKVKVKDEILSINGIETKKLISNIYDHISSQANIQTYKTQRFNTFFATLIPYALGLPKAFEIVVKENNGSIKLHKAKEMANELYDPTINSCSNDLCLEIVEEKTAVLTISSFNYYEWNNYSVFKSFLDSSMRIINNKKIKNLIIDVRYNRGGSQHPSIYLLQYLMDKPFTYYSKVESEGKTSKTYGEENFHPLDNRFKGKVYFLIDGNGRSTTGHFMSLVKVHNLGTIIGEELGSNQFCTAGQTLFRLNNTKLVVSSANNTHVSTATKLPDEIGILPDFFVTQSIDDYLNKVDAVKDYALKLIRK